ncbi:MAG: hypothetical protein ACRERE_30820 [Candidatus Entotheonellia bacterium]
MTRAAHVGLSLIGAVLFLAGVPAGFAEERFERKIVKTHLTACSTVPGKVGTCEGTLDLEHQAGEKAERTIMQVTRDTVLKNGEQKAFLFQLEGSNAMVTYVKEGDQRMATSVVAKPD